MKTKEKEKKKKKISIFFLLLFIIDRLNDRIYVIILFYYKA
jgi:hypothetical protein